MSKFFALNLHHLYSIDNTNLACVLMPNYKTEITDKITQNVNLDMRRIRMQIKFSIHIIYLLKCFKYTTTIGLT